MTGGGEQLVDKPKQRPTQLPQPLSPVTVERIGGRRRVWRPAALARHNAGTLRELENEPRVPAAEAIRQAREDVCGTPLGRTPQPSMTGSRRIPSDYRSGRYWARTSDLRLVEAALSQLS